MNIPHPLYAKHLVRPVPACGRVPVQLIVGKEPRLLELERFKHFSDLTLVSRESCSKRTSDLRAINPHSLVKRLIGEHARPIETAYFFDTRFMDSNNISHLLMDVIPLCLCVKEVVRSPAFIFRPLGSRFRELLSYFGMEPICTYKPVRGRELSFRLTRGLAKFEIEAAFDVPIYSYTGEVYSDYFRATGEHPRKVFLSRRGPRAPVNEAQAVSLLQSRGFETLYLEDYSIPEQVSLIQAADDIVAVHGAAMAFLTLKESIRTVVELLPPSVYHDHFPIGLGHKTEKFFQLIPSFDDDVQFRGWSAISRCKDQPFSIDLDQLTMALDAAGI
jgi:hypothetical protein